MLRKNFIKPITSIKDNEKKLIFMNIKELGENHAGLYKDIMDSVTKKSRDHVENYSKIINYLKNPQNDVK